MWTEPNNESELCETFNNVQLLMYCDIAVMGRKGTACSDYRLLLVNVSALHIALYILYWGAVPEFLQYLCLACCSRAWISEQLTFLKQASFLSQSTILKSLFQTFFRTMSVHIDAVLIQLTLDTSEISAIKKVI